MPKYYGPKIPIEIDSDSNITSPKDLLASPIPVFYRDPSDSTLQTTQLYKTVRGGRQGTDTPSPAAPSAGETLALPGPDPNRGPVRAGAPRSIIPLDLPAESGAPCHPKGRPEDKPRISAHSAGHHLCSGTHTPSPPPLPLFSRTSCQQAPEPVVRLSLVFSQQEEGAGDKHICDPSQDAQPGAAAGWPLSSCRFQLQCAWGPRKPVVGRVSGMGSRAFE